MLSARMGPDALLHVDYSCSFLSLLFFSHRVTDMVDPRYLQILHSGICLLANIYS